MNRYAINAAEEFQRIARLPLSLAYFEATEQVRIAESRAKVKGRWRKNGKLTVRMMKSGEYRHLIVLRSGNYYVSSYTWEGLIRKAANPYTWKRFDRTVVLKKRWKE